MENKDEEISLPVVFGFFNVLMAPIIGWMLPDEFIDLLLIFCATIALFGIYWLERAWGRMGRMVRVVLLFGAALVGGLSYIMFQPGNPFREAAEIALKGITLIAFLYLLMGQIIFDNKLPHEETEEKKKGE